MGKIPSIFDHFMGYPDLSLNIPMILIPNMAILHSYGIYGLFSSKLYPVCVYIYNIHILYHICISPHINKHKTYTRVYIYIHMFIYIYTYAYIYVCTYLIILFIRDFLCSKLLNYEGVSPNAPIIGFPNHQRWLKTIFPLSF
jgi:hypothetical protein